MVCFFFLMIRRPPRSTQSRSSAASDVYKRQGEGGVRRAGGGIGQGGAAERGDPPDGVHGPVPQLSLIHISEPTRPY